MHINSIKFLFLMKISEAKKEKIKQEKRRMIIEYIKTHPKATWMGIKKDLKLHVERYFKGLKEAFLEANVQLPRSFEIKTPEEKKKILIDYIRRHPTAGGHTITRDTKMNYALFFPKITDLYKSAGVEYPRKNDSKVKRQKLQGVALREIKIRTAAFEDKIASQLTFYGNVQRHVRGARGIADVLLENNGKNVVIEIKDHHARNIYSAHIEQVNRYLEDFQCTTGILICNKLPKKDKFLINNNTIWLLKESELYRIPSLLEGS